MLGDANFADAPFMVREMAAFVLQEEDIAHGGRLLRFVFGGDLDKVWWAEAE